MKGLKFLVSCVAVGALAVICSTASFADDTYSVSAEYSYDAETDKATVKIGDLSAYKAIVGENNDLTLLILTAAGNSAESITNSNSDQVIQIDQAKDFTNVSVPVKQLTEGETYYVRIGGAEKGETGSINENGYVSGEFTVQSAVVTPQVLIGDVNGDEAINASDLTEVAKYNAQFTSSLNNSDVNMAAAAYATGDNSVNASDLTEIAKYNAQFAVTYVGTTVDLGTYATE